MKQRKSEPVLPELKHMLVDMAAAQAKSSRRPLWRPFALGGAIAGVAAVLLIVLGGGGATIRTERADAADLTQLAAKAPRLQLAGPWQIASAEVSPGGGAVQFHSEEERGENLYEGYGPGGAFSTKEVEIQWHSVSIEERGRQLESEGFTFAGQKRMQVSRPAAIAHSEVGRSADVRRARVYVSREDHKKGFQAAGLWREGDRTLEYRAVVPSFWVLARLMERIELLSGEEWFIALQPGGGRWLNESASGTMKKIEEVKIGEASDGRPVYRVRGLIGTREPGEKLDFKAPFPTIYREGDNVRVVTQQPPQGAEQP
jgi:hypothetical protein